MVADRLSWLERGRAAAQTTGVAARLVARTFIPPLRTQPLGHELSGPQRLERGLILVLPGIGGESFMTHHVARGIDRAGAPEAIEIFNWASSRVPILGNLMTYRQNRLHALRLAKRIRGYQRDYPGRQVHLVGYSGGAGEAIFTLEHLNPAQPIAGAILLGVAVSPQYDLTAALRRTTFGIYNLYNRHDRILLGLSMVAVGTLDRRHRLAAGMVGFRPPEGLDPSDADVYRTKLHQRAWDCTMVAHGHRGGHGGWTSPAFVERWVGEILAAHRLGKVAAV